jgi:hypothetical protein
MNKRKNPKKSKSDSRPLENQLNQSEYPEQKGSEYQSHEVLATSAGDKEMTHREHKTKAHKRAA